MTTLTCNQFQTSTIVSNVKKSTKVLSWLSKIAGGLLIGGAAYSIYIAVKEENTQMYIVSAVLLSLSALLIYYIPMRLVKTLQSRTQSTINATNQLLKQVDSTLTTDNVCASPDVITQWSRDLNMCNKTVNESINDISQMNPDKFQFNDVYSVRNRAIKNCQDVVLIEESNKCKKEILLTTIDQKFLRPTDGVAKTLSYSCKNVLDKACEDKTLDGSFCPISS